MEHVFNLRSNTCICFLIVSFEKTCKKLDFVLHHGFQTPRNKWKQSAYCLVFSSVSRCLEPVMMHLPSFLTYYVKHYNCKHHSVFSFLFIFYFFETGGRLKFAKVLTFRLRSIRCACKRFDGDCKNYHSLAHPKKVSRLQKKKFGGLKKKTLW